ncbi:MAG: LPS export ABC transporter permease LptF [Gammaproteobacteria bacterium]
MILERYLYREVLVKLIWIIGLLVLILTSSRFVDYLADAAAGKLPSDLILKLLLVRMLTVLPRLLPVALFLSVLLALARLSHDKELTIMSGAGLPGSFHLLSIFRFSLLFALLVFIVSFFITPWAENELGLLKSRARQEADVSGLTAGRFKEFSRGDRVVYVKEMGGGKQSMKDVFLQVRQKKRLAVLTSDSARFEDDKKSGGRYILFENGHRYVGTPGMLDYRITTYRHYAVLLQQIDGVTAVRKTEAVPSSELFGSDIHAYQAEFQWRLSFVIATLLLPLLAVVLNRFSFGENRHVSLMIGILIYFIYSNMLGISKNLLKRGELEPFIGLWWVHILLIIAIVVFLKLQGARFRRGRAAAHQLSAVER